jgi:hypothetical protein
MIICDNIHACGQTRISVYILHGEVSRVEISLCCSVSQTENEFKVIFELNSPQVAWNPT